MESLNRWCPVVGEGRRFSSGLDRVDCLTKQVGSCHLFILRVMFGFKHMTRLAKWVMFRFTLNGLTGRLEFDTPTYFASPKFMQSDCNVRKLVEDYCMKCWTRIWVMLDLQLVYNSFTIWWRVSTCDWSYVNY